MVMRKHIISMMTAVMMSTMILTGCNGDALTTMDNGGSDYYTDSMAVGVSAQGSNFASRLYNTSDSADYEYGQSTETDSNSSFENDQETNSRKLIRTVSLDMKLSNSDQLTEVMENTVALANKYQGYVSNQSQDSGYDSSGSMTVRIPKDKTDGFLSELKDQDSAEISNYSDNLEDVTMQYTDVDSRLQSAKTAKERYMEMLGKAETVTDVLEIQGRIDEIIANEESYQRQLTSMDSQIEYSTIRVTYRCVINKEKPSVTSRIGQSLLELVEEAFDTLLHAFTWFILCVIWLAFIIPLMFLVVRAFMFAIGKGKKREKKGKNVELPKDSKEGNIKI